MNQRKMLILDAKVVATEGRFTITQGILDSCDLMYAGHSVRSGAAITAWIVEYTATGRQTVFRTLKAAKVNVAQAIAAGL